MKLRSSFLLLLTLLFFSCRKSLLHERWIVNQSSDTVFVWNPDFEDTIYVIAPSLRAMIYSYEILDTEQPSEKCGWMGDTLFIMNSKDSVLEKSVSLEGNWTTVVSGEKDRKQECIFTLHDTDF